MTPTFHKIDRKKFKGIISGLHFTTFVNILPKLRYFELYTNRLKETFSSFVFPVGL